MPTQNGKYYKHWYEPFILYCIILTISYAVRKDFETVIAIPIGVILTIVIFEAVLRIESFIYHQKMKRKSNIKTSIYKMDVTLVLEMPETHIRDCKHFFKIEFPRPVSYTHLRAHET